MWAVYILPGRNGRDYARLADLGGHPVSLTSVLNNATSGMLAAQANLRATADNIANVNTPSYVRKVAVQAPHLASGTSGGVDIIAIERVTDQFLQSTSLTATANANRWSTVSNTVDMAQTLFGDPSGTNYYFDRLDNISAAFSASAQDPTSGQLRAQALSSVQDFLIETHRISGEIARLRTSADSRISGNVQTINDLLTQISTLNTDISRANVMSGDSSGPANRQAQLIDDLSKLIDVQVQARSLGGVTVRSVDNFELVGTGNATLSYQRNEGTPGYLTLTSANGAIVNQPIKVAGGEIRGLMDLRDNILPGMADQLGEWSGRVTQQINAAHNASTTLPAPTSLTGRNTGLDLPSAVSHFTGATTVAIVNAQGIVQNTATIDFDAQTMSDGTNTLAFTPATFLSQLNTTLGGNATASFANGTLSLATTSPNGLAIDEGTSAKSGLGFSHFFGLNDLVRQNGFTPYETGLTPTDNHGFTAGQSVTFQVSQADGIPQADIKVTIPSGTTMQDLLDALNSSTTGLGLYGTMSLDAKGQMKFAANDPAATRLSVKEDTTQRGAGGPFMSQLFGLDQSERLTRASRLYLDNTIAASPSKLAMNTLDLSVAQGKPSIRPGDGGGALAMANALSARTSFQAAGNIGSTTTTLGDYAAQFASDIGRRAATADSNTQSNAAIQAEATARRESKEGVNLDEELVRMTTYQQAFNASARMIQASKELFDALLGII